MIQHAVIEGLEADADVLTIHIARISLQAPGARVCQTISKTDLDFPKGARRESPQKRMARAENRGGL